MLSFVNGITCLCQLNTTRLKIVKVHHGDLIYQIEQGNYLVIKSESNSRFYEKDSLYETRVKIMREIYNKYYTNFQKLCTRKAGVYLKELADANNLTYKTIRKYLVRYMQSGFDEHSLIDSRKVVKKSEEKRVYTQKQGRPNIYKNKGKFLDDEDYSFFDEAISTIKKGRTSTYSSSYRLMLARNYVNSYQLADGTIKAEYKPPNEIPTFAQFYNYAKKKVSKVELDAIKTSVREQRNNQRLLLSDSLSSVTGPGDLFEMDECEIDCFLVSSYNPMYVIGRPILYFMVDVYSRAIVGYSLAFDNNSFIGATNCFKSLIDEKDELCRKNGIVNDFWPSDILPTRLRCDYGSEYISHQLERLCNDLGITKELATPGTGSLKGLVEQKFHQFHSFNKPLLENKGLITKRYDSNHKETAALTIKDFETLVVTFIYTHNHSFMEKYPLTKKMRQKEVKPTPIELWKYGVERYGSPRPIVNKEQFKYSLLQDVNATLSRDGIKYDNFLYYVNMSDVDLTSRMYANGNTREKFECRIDPRDVGSLYYIKDNQVQTAVLNPAKTGNAEFAGLNLYDYQIVKKEIRKLINEGVYETTLLKAAAQDRSKTIINSVDKHEVISENLRQTREQEKKIIQKEKKIFEQESPQELPVKEKDTFEYKPITLEEALESVESSYSGKEEYF